MPDNEEGDMDVLRQELQKGLLHRKREGGEVSDDSSLSKDGQARMGVLLRLLTAVENEDQYRQAILTSDLIDDEEADRLSAAVSEANRYGLSVVPIMDWLAARCAVNKLGHGKSRTVVGIEGLTHSTFSTFGSNSKNRFSLSDNKKEDNPI